LKPKRKAAFLAGVQVMLATIPGNFAWGLVVGLGMINAGLSMSQSLGFALLVYSGSAQMVAVPLMSAGAALGLTLLAAALACIRFVIYSAAIAPALHRAPLRTRLFVGTVSIDGAIGMFLLRCSKTGPGKPPFTHRISYLLGMDAPVWAAWTTGMLVGIFAAGLLPASPKFTYLGIVAMMGILVPMVRDRASLSCAVVSATVSLFTFHWPYQLGLLTAILAGIATGFVARPRALASASASALATTAATPAIPPAPAVLLPPAVKGKRT
jgi:predicted branched-subunit amino acid permease